jgi:hypothetical protein
MKWMILTALMLGVGSAAAAGYVAMQSAAAETAVESDSSRTTVETPDSTGQMNESTDDPGQMDEPQDSVTTSNDSAEEEPTLVLAVPDSTGPKQEVGCPTVEVATAVDTTSTPAPVAPDPEAQKQAYRQVARILSNMGDAEVGQLLAHIEDEEIEMILRNVTAREGARILSQLSAERAAELSRRLLHASTESGGRN